MLPGHPQTVVGGMNEEERVSVIYCCMTNSPPNPAARNNKHHLALFLEVRDPGGP